MRAASEAPGLDPAGLGGRHDARPPDGAQRTSASLFLGTGGGWGYCLAAPGPLRGEPPIPWGFGWNGGTGITWSSDLVRGLTGILLTNRAMTSPEPPAHFVDFWQAAYDARAG